MDVMVIGASTNPRRTSNEAIKMLRSYGHDIVAAIGSKVARVGDVDITDTRPELEQIDTITLYVNPTILRSYIDYIIDLQPRRVIFNPGTEDEDIMQRFAQAGILVEEACTLVLLRTNQF